MQQRDAARLQSTSGTEAIVLAGGLGARLGGVDKAALTLHGTTLLDRLLAALAGLDPAVGTVVVGPPRAALPRGVRVAREAPVHGGPAAAAVAGLAALPDADDVLLLAVDAPGAALALPRLVAATAGPDGVVAVDPDGRDQWLLGRYRAAALRAAAAARPDWTGAPLRALVGGLALARLPLPADLTRDVDTVADAKGAGVRLPDGEEARMSDDGDVLGAWWTTLTAALGLPEVPADREAILGLAGEAAHAVVRPAAPLTTFLAGYAAGRAGGSAADVERALEQARAAAAAR